MCDLWYQMVWYYYKKAQEVDKMNVDIYIDIDEKMSKKKVEGYIRDKLKIYNKSGLLRENIDIKEVYYRKSSSGNTHLKFVVEIDKVIIREEDTYILLMLSFRAIFGDDAMRIKADLCRYALHMDVNRINKIFDTKALFDEDGNMEIKRAGKWVKISI